MDKPVLSFSPEILGCFEGLEILPDLQKDTKGFPCGSRQRLTFTAYQHTTTLRLFSKKVTMPTPKQIDILVFCCMLLWPLGACGIVVAAALLPPQYFSLKIHLTIIWSMVAVVLALSIRLDSTARTIIGVRIFQHERGQVGYQPERLAYLQRLHQGRMLRFARLWFYAGVLYRREGWDEPAGMNERDRRSETSNQKHEDC